MFNTTKCVDFEVWIEGVKADPDIVGPGVIAAFIITAGLALTVVIWAYLFGCLDEGLLGELDRKWIARFTRSKVCAGPSQLQSEELSRTQTAFSARLNLPRADLREKRKEFFTQFMLRLSDSNS
jgi:hypothetical protein